MSFLANLRQQNNSEQPLQLCYLLSIDQQHIAHLHLCLAELHQARPHLPGKPYFVQLQHLERPPQFLSPQDRNILQALVTADAEWFNHQSGGLPELNTWGFLQELLATGRCYSEYQPGRWQLLAQGEDCSLQLCWLINERGEQFLDWQTPQSESKVFYVSRTRFCKPLLYNTRDHRLGLAITELNAQAEKAISKIKPLNADAVEYFLQCHQDDWEQLTLPLPVLLSCEETSAQLIPLIVCQSVRVPSEPHGIRNEIQLHFALATEHYCTRIEGKSAPTYWDGSRLHQLQYDESEIKLRQAEIARNLAYFSARQHFGEDLPSVWYSRKEEDWQQLFGETIHHLTALGANVVIAQHFFQHYVFADSWQVEMQKGDDKGVHFSIHLSVGKLQIDLGELLAQLQTLNQQLKPAGKGKNQRFTLPDGRLLLIPAAQIKSLTEELGDLRYEAGVGFQLPKRELHRLASIHHRLPSATDWQGDLDHLHNAINLHQSPIVLDSKLSCVNAELRPYQWLGVCWMQHIKQHNINGLLADDMGLGKTLQTLAHLSFEHQQQRLTHPALIIMPTTLLQNWAREIKRFTPQLRVKIIHGVNRHQWWASLNEYDIVLSSYQLLINDLEHWQAQPLSWLILDEAQAIKNPRTRVSQAVREIACENKLCLSGTPVENHLGELWSILDFLMPGCLGSAKHFKSHFQKPVELDGNANRMAQLLERIAPFMLRRSKDQIARDLPAKTEIYQSIPLNDDQQQFYQQLKSLCWSDLQTQLDDTDAPGQQHIMVLNALLKLRQACCDPALLDAPHISSAKREYCVQMLCELVAEKRSVLVFSQFTSMLELLAEALTKENIPYLMLTGKSQHRQQLVDDFQAGKAPIFLISLKAGGTGLNLTHADTVIHYDPWWNQAAEQQATDRAHRIGQDKPVFVYKLITENTIEEKIAALQARKAVLSQHVNNQAQLSGENFAFKFEDLMSLWQEENSIV
ncbi:MAG: DEAD/DEAH box helicase [Pseudomonadota bacterium]